jgi:hypothetical protein
MAKLIFGEQDKFNALLDLDYFILDGDSVFCVRDTCEGCEYQDVCEVEEREGSFLENYYNKATRDNIRAGIVEEAPDWVTLHPCCEEALNQLQYKNGTYSLGDVEPSEEVAKNLFLANSDKIYLKEAKGLEEVEEDFLLYKVDEDKKYCIKKCEGCEHQKVCTPIISETISNKKFVAIDSSAQEPMVVTFLSEEPEYVKIFKNNSIKNIPYLTDLLFAFFEDVFGWDSESPKIATFIDWVGFEDKTLLYLWSSVLYENLKEYNEDSLNNLKSEIYNKKIEFDSKVKEGKISYK